MYGTLFVCVPFTQSVVDLCAEGGLETYPERDYQLGWIRTYLEYKAKLGGKLGGQDIESEINNIYKGAVICSLVGAQLIYKTVQYLQIAIRQGTPAVHRTRCIDIHRIIQSQKHKQMFAQ